MSIVNRLPVWAVAGPAEGLGAATLRYLLTRERIVIAISEEQRDPGRLMVPKLENARLIVTPESISCPCLDRITADYGPIDVLVDNCKSLPVLRFLLSYMTAGSGRIILTPPLSGYDLEVAAMLPRLDLPETISTYLCSGS
jgi:hypothetical protein